jgi:hypothetical protein
MKQAFSPLLGFMLLSTPLAATAQQYGPFRYSVNGATVTIQGCSGSVGAVTIPATINCMPVVSIGPSAFFECTNVTAITIPSSVTNMGDYAFNACNSLASITIPNGVETIGDYAFCDCYSLTNVTIGGSVISIGNQAFRACTSLTGITIPSNVTNIGSQAFIGCGSLNSITVSSLNNFYSSAGGVLLNKSQTMLIQFPEGKGGAYTIPNSVTSIEAWAFENCASLASVTIGNSVTNIPSLAFVFCRGLTNVVLLASGINIEDDAFAQCSGLTSLLFEGNAPRGGDGCAFVDGEFATIYYMPGTTGWGNGVSDSGGLFRDLPAVLWNPAVQAASVRNNRLNFDITGTTNIPVVVEASTNLAGGVWVPLQSGTLTNGLLRFTDPVWTHYPTRFYRIGFP